MLAARANFLWRVVVVTVVGVVALLPAAVVSGNKFEDCGSSGSGIELNLSGGCSKEPVELTKGEKCSFQLKFTPGEDSDKLTNSITGILGGNVEVPYNQIMTQDFCSQLVTGSCPVSAGSPLVFSADVNVLPTYPSIPVTIKWQVKTSSGSNAVCILIKAKII